MYFKGILKSDILFKRISDFKIPLRSFALKENFVVCNQKKFLFFSDGFPLILGISFMHFKAFITETNSFGGFELGKPPLNVPLVCR